MYSLVIYEQIKAQFEDEQKWTLYNSSSKWSAWFKRKAEISKTNHKDKKTKEWVVNSLFTSAVISRKASIKKLIKLFDDDE